MSIENLLSKRAIDLTASELADVVIFKLQASTPPQKEEKRIVRGIHGIMSVLNCSRSKAASLSASGILEDAIVSRAGSRIILYDAEMILTLLK